MVEEDLMEAMEVVMEVMVMEVMVMERGMLNLVMEVMEAMVEDLMEAMVMVMEVMVMERGMLNLVTEVMEVMEEDLMEAMVAADLMEDMEDTMDKMDNITFHSSYAPKIVNTSACKFTQLLFVIN